MAAGTAAMAGALGFQAWLSVAKPWRRTRWARHAATGHPVRLPTAPAALFAAAVIAPPADIAVGTAVGFPDTRAVAAVGGGGGRPAAARVAGAGPTRTAADRPHRGRDPRDSSVTHRSERVR
jgi:hypothetical protein